VVRVPAYLFGVPVAILSDISFFFSFFFLEVTGLERGQLSLMSIFEQLLERKGICSGLEN
jgi:hypothetical protein